MAGDPGGVCDLAWGGDRFAIAVTPWPRVAPNEERFYDVDVDVRAFPFTGHVKDAALADDLRFFATNLQRMIVLGSVVFGSERTMEIVLEVERQEGGPPDALVVEASVAVSGDRSPRLTLVLMNQRPFWEGAAAAILAILGPTPASDHAQP